MSGITGNRTSPHPQLLTEYLLAGHKSILFPEGFPFSLELTLFELMFKLSVATNSTPGVVVECWRDVRIACPSSYVSGSWNAPILPCSLSGRVKPVVPPSLASASSGLSNTKLVRCTHQTIPSSPALFGPPSPVCDVQADGPSRELLSISFQRLPNATVILWNCLSGAVSRSGQASVLNGYPEELPGREFGVRYGKSNVRARSETPCIQPHAVLASIFWTLQICVLLNLCTSTARPVPDYRSGAKLRGEDPRPQFSGVRPHSALRVATTSRKAISACEQLQSVPESSHATPSR